MDPLDTTAYFTQIDSLDSTTNASNSIHKSTFAGGNCVAVKTVLRNYTTKPVLNSELRTVLETYC
jgi:hypothetical protein